MALYEADRANSDFPPRAASAIIFQAAKKKRSTETLCVLSHITVGIISHPGATAAAAALCARIIIIVYGGTIEL
jgi:hypothetical protein